MLAVVRSSLALMTNVPPPELIAAFGSRQETSTANGNPPTVREPQA
jgi:hypothetical protein